MLTAQAIQLTSNVQPKISFAQIEAVASRIVQGELFFDHKNIQCDPAEYAANRKAYWLNRLSRVNDDPELRDAWWAVEATYSAESKSEAAVESKCFASDTQ